MEPAREKCQPTRIIEPEIIVIISKSLMAIAFKGFLRILGIIPTRASDPVINRLFTDFERLSALPGQFEPKLNLTPVR